METLLTERQLREKEYYEQYAEKNGLSGPIDFSPIDGVLSGTERRPWNSYWRTYELPINAYLALNPEERAEATLLDFGCGPGDNSLRFSRVGFKVTGFDISENNIKSCKDLFEKNSTQGTFVVSVAETLPFSDDTFNVVAGLDILHHVDIFRSINEVKRVLKNEGIAIFREPIEVPFLDNIRNTALIKMLVPNKASLENHITEDERKLNKEDLKLIKKIFPELKIERSLILSRLDKFIRKGNNPKPSFLEKLDYVLCKVIPFYENLGGAVVIILTK